MAVEMIDQEREIAAFCEEVIGDLDRRLARIERTQHGSYRSLPAWQHLTRRRAQLLRLRAETWSPAEPGAGGGSGFGRRRADRGRDFD